jgi:hypothetical protein
MRRHAERATKEALGCFVMLILGAFLALGVMVLVPTGIGELLRGNDAERWRSILMRLVAWVVAPAIGIVLVAWLTYKSKRGE